jgi:hypothetical protein
MPILTVTNEECSADHKPNYRRRRNNESFKEKAKRKEGT